MDKINNQGGFTLLEISLTLALIGILFGLASPFLWSLVKQTDLDVSVYRVVNSLRRAQSLSMAMQADANWGVKLAEKQVVIFAGNNFDVRNSELDEVFFLPENFTYQGSTEFVFQKYSGLPNFIGSAALENASGQSKGFSINRLGVIEY